MALDPAPSDRAMATSTYHHPDLAATLRSAAADLITERGPAGFSLREVARRADVSHAAPAHHFGDVTGLLTSVAIEAFDHLDAEMGTADDVADPVERLVAVGRAYVRIAHRHPGHCAVVFRSDIIDVADERYVDGGQRAYSHVHGAVAALADELAPDLDVDLAARLCWATMQGLVELHSAMANRAAVHGEDAPAPLEDEAERMARLVIAGLVGSDHA